MKKTLIALALLSAMGVASAQNNGANNTLQNGGAAAGANSAAGSVSGSDSRSAAVAGASGSADSQSGALSGSQSSITMNVEASQPLRETVTTTNHVQSGQYTVKSAPGIAMSGPASGPCTGRSGGLGASWLGGGVGLNYAEVDRGCMLRENARMFAMILPVLDGDDKNETRAMLMDTLRTMHAEQNIIKQPRQ